jgi:hypothetical protein
MRNLILSALILVSAFQTAFGATEGGWTFTVVNNKAQITSYSWSGGAVTIPSTLGGYPVGTISGQISRSIFGDSSSSITSITIPNSITTIGDYAFYGCSSLASVNIPNTVTSIGNNAFSMCTSLNSIVIPNSVITIGSSFYGCSALTSINLGNGVTTIGDYAFQNCTAINSITIPTSVTGVGTSAFADCTRLNGVYFQGNAPNTGFGVFTRSQPTVYYLPGTTGWGSNFAGRPTALTATLTFQYDSSKGSVVLSPSQSFYSSGAEVYVQAIAKQGYVFGGWIGEYRSVSAPVVLENFQFLHETTIIMNSNNISGVTFLQDNNDSDLDGLTNFQESTVYSSNPYQADSNSDGYNDGLAVSLGYSPSINFSALISHLQSHPPTGLYTANQMQAMAFGDLVLTKNANGSFTLNYDIEQSTDLQSWSIYAPLSLPLTDLPPDKAFIRIKARQ